MIQQSTLGYISEENENIWKDICTPVFTAALFIIARTKPKCLSVNRLMDKDVTD